MEIFQKNWTRTRTEHVCQDVLGSWTQIDADWGSPAMPHKTLQCVKAITHNVSRIVTEMVQLSWVLSTLDHLTPFRINYHTHLSSCVTTASTQGWNIKAQCWNQRGTTCWNQQGMACWNQEGTTCWIEQGMACWIQHTTACWNQQGMACWNQHATTYWNQHSIACWNQEAMACWFQQDVACWFQHAVLCWF